MAKKHSKESDEFSIDFSKVFGFLKKSPKHSTKAETHEEPMDAPADEADKEEIEKSNQDDDFSFDIKGAWKGLYRYRAVFLILIPILFAIFFRMQTLYIPQTDAWAQNSIQNYLNNQISAQVDQQYPNLPSANKADIVDKEVQNYIDTHKAEYNQQIKDVSNNFKSHFKDETGQPYLIELDCYQWYRYGRDIIKHGYMGDKIVDGKAYDMHMLAPFGIPIRQELSPYVGAYLYKVMHALTGANLMGAFFIVPIIIMALAVIPAFFIGKRLGGDIGGFFTAMLFAIHPAILSRTMGGAPDTDPYVVIFPLLAFWMLIESFEADKRLNKMIYAALTGLMIGLFAFAWYGWWYVFDFIIATIALYGAYHIISEYIIKKRKQFSDLKNDNKAKNILIMFGIFLATSMIFVVLFTDITTFLNGFVREPLTIITLKEAAHETLWPNVYTTVAEMNAAPVSSIIAAMGGKIFFAIGLLGIFLLLLKGSKGDRRVQYFIFLAIWFFGAFYATTKGVRFTLILAPAYIMGFGVAISLTYSYASRWISKEMNINISLTKATLVIIFCLMLIPTLNIAKATSLGEVSMMNDAWYNSLSKIDKEASKDAIVNSWWDYGHWFKAIADRAVTFDGASQNEPQAHWIGKALLTSNENETIGILKMLDCGANRAFDTLYNDTGDMHGTIDIIYKIIVMNKEDARDELLKYVSADEADKVLQYTHCTPPEDYFITSEDMVGKSGVWAHFGSWDFERAKIWTEYRKKNMQDAVAGMEQDFNYSKDYAEKMYYEVQAISDENEANSWISPWPSFIGSASCQKKSNTTLVCQFSLQDNQVIPIQINLTTEDAFIETTKGIIRPVSLVSINKNGEFEEKKYNESSFPYSVAIMQKGEAMEGVLMMPQLSSSMFTRLFYFNANGLKHFDLFEYQKDITGQDIYIWKVNWEGKSNLNTKNNTNPTWS